jgi:hypothetical protein
MSTEPAACREVSSEHFERNPGIEDSVTKSYKDKADAVCRTFRMGGYDGGPRKE